MMMRPLRVPGQNDMKSGRNWKKNVYRPAEPVGMTPELTEKIALRDNYTCQSCGGDVSARPSIHHIIPRSEGGRADPDNLITLCKPCHDAIEVSNLRSAWAIQRNGSKQRGVKKSKSKAKPKPVISPTDWRTWVYGGGKNPKK